MESIIVLKLGLVVVFVFEGVVIVVNLFFLMGFYFLFVVLMVLF